MTNLQSVCELTVYSTPCTAASAVTSAERLGTKAFGMEKMSSEEDVLPENSLAERPTRL